MTPHLRGNVRAYVDRALPVALLRVFDQHLVACEVCRAAAEQERRIVAALQADTGVPQSLRSALLGLAEAEPYQPPEVPEAPARIRLHHLPASPFRDARPHVREPVPTVAPNAPALHRSPVRAAVVASLAATASVAAAWGLTVVPLQASTRTPTPAARVPVGAASLGPSSFGQAVSARSTSGRSTPGTFTNTSGVRLAPSSATTDGLLRELSASSSMWTVPTASPTPFGLTDLLTPVRVDVVRSADSRP